MRTFLLILIVSIGFLLSGFLQLKPPIKNVYGYKQANIPGILPTYIEENDIAPKAPTKPKLSLNYWFYVEIPKTQKINITGLWISGIQHNIRSEVVNDLPAKKIIFTGMEKNDTVVMMPVTKNKVMLIKPSGESKDTIIRSNYISNLAQANELVIRYTWENKTFYTTMKKLKELNPDVRQ